jgi:hypothetical protein
MVGARLLLLTFGFVCFVIHAIWAPTTTPRVNLQSAGLAFWIAATFLV